MGLITTHYQYHCYEYNGYIITLLPWRWRCKDQRWRQGDDPRSSRDHPDKDNDNSDKVSDRVS